MKRNTIFIIIMFFVVIAQLACNLRETQQKPAPVVTKVPPTQEPTSPPAPPPPDVSPTPVSNMTPTPDSQPAPCEAGEANASSPLDTHQVYRAFSDDGYDFTPENKLLIDHASVPDGVIGPDGALWVYYINGEPGRHGLFVSREREDGQWETIDCVRLNGQFEGNAVDPDIIRLPDGRYRLFYFLGHFVTRPKPGQPAEHPIYSAISEDGLNFTVEQQLIAVEGVTDPTVVQLPDGSWLMALVQGEQNQTLLVASSDGYHFELTGTVIKVDGIPELAVMPDERVRLYLTRSLISDDGGQTWTEEPQRFVPSPDPSLVAMPDGSYVMFYKKFANQPSQGPGSQGNNPPPPNRDNPPPPAPPDEGMIKNPQVTIAQSLTDLQFIPDAGLRVDYASLPNVGIDPDSGTVHLYYNTDRTHPTTPNKELHATASDGLNFSQGETYTTYPFDSRNALLPDGTWRRYRFEPDKGAVTSSHSTDGVHFTPEAGLRYILQESDRGWMGVNTVFSNPQGKVVHVYLGDKNGLNNARLAYSTDGGDTFTFLKANIFGDEIMGGGGQSFVDPSSLLLPDGRVRLVTMRMGHVYTFISTNEQYTEFVYEGLQLVPSDFTEFKVGAFFDPKAILLPDGRIRVYAAALIESDDGSTRQAIISATSATRAGD